VRSTLDELWESIIRGKPCGELSFLKRYESLIPGEEVPWTPLNPLAENAIAAVAYACKCQVEGTTECALWAAVQGYEAVDYIAHTVEGIAFEGPEAEGAILSNEYVQGEIENQLREIGQLESSSIDGEGIEELAEAFRRRAVSASKSLVTVLSKLPR